MPENKDYLCHMKKIIFISLAILCSSFSVFAQKDYQTAIGLRLNGGAGLTVRHNLDDKHSIEGILYTRWHGVNLTGLYQLNYPVFTEEPGFRFYMGGGGHIGIWDRHYSPWWDEDSKGSHLVIGLDGQLGLEYTFKDIPLNLSIDWKPAFNIIGVTNFWGDDVALSVRYTIK
jgi:hypothetical protein